MSANVRVDIASEFVGKKAFLDATKQTIGLNNQVKTLAKSYLSLFTIQRLARSGYNAAKAFAEDDKSAQRLTNSVNNLGLAYASDDIRRYIDSLTLASGVADTELRPALQSLLQVTGSLTTSQQLLGTAINVSRGTGEDLLSVANSLSQAYVGNTKGLRQYNLGLTQAELKAKSFAEIQDRINTLFAGSSTAYLKTYAGQMQLLTTRAGEAQEAIGKNLVDALVLLGGDKGIENAADQMDNLVDYTNDVIYGLAVLTSKLNNLPLIGGLGLKELVGAIPVIGGYLTILANAGQAARSAQNSFNFASGGGAGASDMSRVNASKAVAAEKLAKKRQQDILNAQKQQLKITKEQAALQKAGTLFDIQQTQIIAALKGKVTDEERTRLELQLAILTGNTTEASKLAGEVARTQGLTKDLVAFYSGLPNAKNPFAGWITTLSDAEAIARRLMGMSFPTPTSIAGNNTSGTYSPAVQAMIAATTPSVGVTSGGDVVINIAGSVVSEADLVEAVSNGLLNRSLSGSPSAIGRLKGSFGT
jgi:hypothetical protein